MYFTYPLACRPEKKRYEFGYLSYQRVMFNYCSKLFQRYKFGYLSYQRVMFNNCSKLFHGLEASDVFRLPILWRLS